MMTGKKKYKVLLGEDDKFIGRAYSDGLKDAGFDVDIALDGEETIAKMRESRPDLLLLDIIMPNKNGFEVLEEIQLDPELRTVPVVVLSNLGQDSDKEKASELGCVDYLVKSDLSLQDVVDKVQFHLARHNVAK